jgi:hypothetical protein
MPVRRAEWRVRSKPVSKTRRPRGRLCGVMHHPDALPQGDARRWPARHRCLVLLLRKSGSAKSQNTNQARQGSRTAEQQAKLFQDFTRPICARPMPVRGAANGHARTLDEVKFKSGPPEKVFNEFWKPS